MRKDQAVTLTHFYNRYAHLADEPVRRAGAETSGLLSRALNAAPTASPNVNVVPFRIVEVR
jgi:hypothetical protein